MFKHLLQAKNFRLTPKRFLSSKVPCPVPPPLDLQCIKNFAEMTKPVVTEPTLWDKTLTHISLSIPFLTPLAPLFYFLAAHHLLFMGVSYCIYPSLLKEDLKNVADTTEAFLLAKRKLVVKRLAAMSDPNFNRLHAFSNFCFEPMRTMASYKDNVFNEANLIRNEGTPAEEENVDINHFKVVVMNEDRFIASIQLSHIGENFRLFVCTNSLIIMEDGKPAPIIRNALMLPRLFYNPIDVSATLDGANMLMLEFRTPSASPRAEASNCFMVPVAHV